MNVLLIQKNVTWNRSDSTRTSLMITLEAMAGLMMMDMSTATGITRRGCSSQVIGGTKIKKKTSDVVNEKGCGKKGGVCTSRG